MSTRSRKRHKRSGRTSASALEARLAAARSRGRPRGRRRGLSGGVKLAGAIGLAVVALGAIFLLNRPGGGPSPSGEYAFQVGSPGPGEQAPPIRLPSTAGGSFDLASLRGKTVLLYFQEGLTCQPCWDQLKDIEAELSTFRAQGIDEIVTITTDPLGALTQVAVDMGLATPVLSDPDLAVSRAYDANSYGMMGGTRNGHTFIVVGPDGRILWRADYGGPPDFNMYVPVPSLVADIRQGLREAP